MLQCVYLLLVNGGYVLFYIYGQRAYIPLSSSHTPLIYLTLACNLATFWLCSRTQPGLVTKENAEAACNIFQYDGSLYLPKVMCPTCMVQKPAVRQQTRARRISTA